MKNDELYPDYARIYKDLPAKVSQQILKLFSQNTKSFFGRKQSKKLTDEERSKKKVNLPKYYTKNGLVVVTFTNQALSKTAFNTEGVIHLSGTDLKIKLDLASLPEIKHFNQINQVRIVPAIKNDKDKRLSDLLEEYYSSNTSSKATPLFTIEIVYTVPKSEKRINNKSLQLLYRNSVIYKINPKTNKIATIEKEELAEARYTQEFLQSVAGIDQNLDYLAVGGNCWLCWRNHSFQL